MKQWMMHKGRIVYLSVSISLRNLVLVAGKVLNDTSENIFQICSAKCPPWVKGLDLVAEVDVGDVF